MDERTIRLTRAEASEARRKAAMYKRWWIDLRREVREFIRSETRIQDATPDGLKRAVGINK